jgi:hypothetical protein
VAALQAIRLMSQRDRGHSWAGAEDAKALGAATVMLVGVRKSDGGVRGSRIAQRPPIEAVRKVHSASDLDGLRFARAERGAQPLLGSHPPDSEKARELRQDRFPGETQRRLCVIPRSKATSAAICRVHRQ